MAGDLKMADWKYRIVRDTTADELRRFGPLIPGGWMHPDATDLNQRIEGLLLVDTGASGVMIDESVAKKLGVPRQGPREIHGAHGRAPAEKYLAKLLLHATDDAGQALLFAIPIECHGIPQLADEHSAFGTNIVGIVGRTFLQFCQLEIDGTAGRVLLKVDDSVRFRRGD